MIKEVSQGGVCFERMTVYLPIRDSDKSTYNLIFLHSMTSSKANEL